MRNVLLLESDHAFAVKLHAEFTRAGCSLQVYADGPSGLSAAAAAPPDVVLVATELPRMNGFSVCNKLKKDPVLGGVPVLLLSTDAAPEIIEQHKRLRTRADDYLSKSSPIHALVERVFDFLPSQDERATKPGFDAPTAPPQSLAEASGKRNADNIPTRPPMARARRDEEETVTGLLAAEPEFLQYRIGDEDSEEATSLATAHVPVFPMPAMARGSEREVLELREALQSRDREMLTLREQATARDREIIDTRELGLAARRAGAELRDRIDALEATLAEAHMTLGATVAEKALAENRALDFKANARSVADDLARRTQELRDARSERDAALANLESQHRTQVEEFSARHREETSILERTHEAQLTALRGDHELGTGEHDAQLQRLAEQQAEAVEASRAAHTEQTHLQLAAAAAELATVRRELGETLDELRREHDAAVLVLKREHAEARDRADRSAVQVDEIASQCASMEEERRGTAMRVDELARLVDEGKANALLAADERKKLEEVRRQEHERNLELTESLRSHEADLVLVTERHTEALAALEREQVAALELANGTHQQALTTHQQAAAEERAQLECELAGVKVEVSDARDAWSDSVRDLAVNEAAAERFEQHRQQFADVLQQREFKLEAAITEWRSERGTLEAAWGQLSGEPAMLDPATNPDGES
ncbi:MAG: response regulator [Myxococcales bacterium]|nr:response regulator [Myxococcales bacterium]